MRRIVSIIMVAALALLSVVSFAGVAVAQNGSIAGLVQTDNGTPIANAAVYAYAWGTDVALGPTFAAGFAYTGSSGTYFILGLDTGNYRVVAHADGFFSEYWDDSATPGGATQVAVADPNQTGNINFTLDAGASISGTVYEDNSSTPIVAARVIAYDASSGQIVDDAWTGASGTYVVGNNLGNGSYKVKAEADGYFSEYYDNVTSSASATVITFTAPENTSDINFTLAKGGSITGLVQADNLTAIRWARVAAYDSDSGLLVDDAWTSENGTYSIGNNVATGNYRVRVDMDGYFSEYYNDKPDSASANLVSVTSPDATADINFTLTPGGSISGYVFEDDGTTPIYAARVIAYASGSGLIIDDGWSRADGKYVIGNSLPNGTYRVAADATGFFSEYYDNVTDSASATLVEVTAPGVTVPSQVDFTLSPQTLVFSFVRASDIGENTATITWTTNDFGTSMVEYGTAPNEYPNQTAVDPTMTDNHTVSLTGLTRGTTYHYRAVSRDAQNHEGRSEDFFFITPDLTPPEITNVAATDITATGATITWTTDEAAESQVEYGTSASYGEITTLDTNLVISHTVALTGLTSGTTYHYMVKSRDTQGSATWSQLGGFTFATLDVTPPAISAVTASGMTQTGATITWTTNEAATSQVEYGPTNQYGSATTLDAALATSHSVSLTGLTAGTTYHYRVKSKDASNNEAVSADFTFATTAAPVPDTTPPTTPVVSDGGDSTTNLTQLHATWTSSDAESGVAEYQYAIGTSAGGTDVVDWTSAGTATSVTRTGLNLGVGSTYYFSVKAKNGEGLWSAVGSSNGILVVEEETPVEPSEDGGMPTWAWIVIGLAGGAIVGGAGYFLAKGTLLKKK